MKYLQTILMLTVVVMTAGCFNNTLEKGFQVDSNSDPTLNEGSTGLNRDSLQLETRPGSVLLTGEPKVRLTTVFKVNVNRRDNSTFIGSNAAHYRYEDEEEERAAGNNWNHNLMPGVAAVYGYNMVNVAHYDVKENRQTLFFDKPALIKTLYYPSFSKDTLNHQPVQRDWFIVSVYDDDTNKDGFVNLKDLRRLYLFDINGKKQKALIPENYSVFQSEYDPANDRMYVFAQLDSNNNGQRDENEAVHIFWIDLKDPNRTGRMY